MLSDSEVLYLLSAPEALHRIVSVAVSDNPHHDDATDHQQGDPMTAIIITLFFLFHVGSPLILFIEHCIDLHRNRNLRHNSAERAEPNGHGVPDSHTDAPLSAAVIPVG